MDVRRSVSYSATLMCFTGWMFVVVLSSVFHPRTSQVVVIVAFGIATLTLLRAKGFPKRKYALLSSAVGPAIIALSSWIRFPHLTTHTVNDLFIYLLLVGVMEVLFMTWLWRGYGLIPILCLIDTLSRGKIRVEQAAYSYPPKYWWVVPVIMALAAVARVVAVYWTISRTLGSYP